MNHPFKHSAAHISSTFQVPGLYSYSGETAAEPQLRVSWAFNIMAKPQTRRQRGGSSTGGTTTGAAAAAAEEFDGAQEDLLDELMDEL